MTYQYFMNEAYKEALNAFNVNEVPVGCVIVHNDKIIGRGFNLRNTEKNVLKHAEIIAINQACEHLSDWRLEECILFVTVEPCAMCSGAILQSRIKTVVFATENPKGGCCGSVINLFDEDGFNHRVEIINGIMKDECKDLVQKFFKRFRKSKDE